MSSCSNKNHIVLASHNINKINELRSLAAGSKVDFILQSQLNISQVEETGLSFIENAILKARHASKHSDKPAIADDSGLVVDALNGGPGVFSRRYAGENASDHDNVRKILKQMAEVDTRKRTARFICIIAYIRHAKDPSPIISEGVWEGMIATQPQGENGFGYDPLFYLPNEQMTAAELNPDTKNTLSHRGQAMRKFIHWLVNS